jgi:hypothetical protein
LQDQGKLIALEGIDESLLSAQAERLYRWLRERGLAAERTGEPTYGPAGAQVRLVRGGRLRLDPQSLALLWTADRLDQLGREDGILAWLADGRHVVCVRYFAYACAYLWGRVEWEWSRAINAPCRMPDLTFYLDFPPSSAGVSGAAALREGYLAALQALRAQGEAIVTLDGTVTPDRLDHAVRRPVADLLGEPLSASVKGNGC